MGSSGCKMKKTSFEVLSTPALTSCPPAVTRIGDNVSRTGVLRQRRICRGSGTNIHAHERFIGFLIDHYAGNFPLWLAPDQVRVITLNDDEALINHAKPIVNELRANQVRARSAERTDGKIASSPEPVRVQARRWQQNLYFFPLPQGHGS